MSLCFLYCRNEIKATHTWLTETHSSIRRLFRLGGKIDHPFLGIQTREPYMDEGGLWHSRSDLGVWVLTLVQPEIYIMILSKVKQPISALFMWKKLWDDGWSLSLPSKLQVHPDQSSQVLWLSTSSRYFSWDIDAGVLFAVSYSFTSSNNEPTEETSLL